DLPFRRLFEFLLILPMFTSGFTLVVAFGALARGDAGILNAFLARLGIPSGFLNVYSFWGLVFVMAVYILPFSFILITGALRTLDSSYAEAVMSTGGSQLRAMLTELRL